MWWMHIKVDNQIGNSCFVCFFGRRIGLVYGGIYLQLNPILELVHMHIYPIDPLEL